VHYKYRDLGRHEINPLNMGFDISEMPGTTEQSMEINVLDSSWTSGVFSWFKCVDLSQPKFLVGMRSHSRSTTEEIQYLG
jgi:hypothetical protein